MRACRTVPVAAFLGALLALSGCGTKPTPQPIDDPPPVAPQPPTPNPVPPAVRPPKGGEKEPVPLPPPTVPVTPADRARLETAEKAGAGVYEAQSGGYEVRVEPGSDAGAILAGLKGTKCVVGLNLEGPKVTDDAFKYLDGFEHLERIALHQCPNVTGTGFGVLPRLPRLKALVLSECPIADAACPAIGRDRALEEMRFIRTKVTDAGLKELAALPALESLGLEGSPITGVGFGTSGWKKLREIDAPHTPFTDAGLNAVGALPAVTVLRLDSTQITNVGLHQLHHSKTLTELYLSGTKITDTGIASLKELDQLQVLDVAKTAVTGATFDRLPARSLRKIVLDGCTFGDGGGHYLGQLTELTALSAKDCPVSDAGLASLKELKKLAKVDLTGTTAGDAAAKVLGALPELEVAAFDRTPLTDAGLKELARAPKLRFVEARGTKVTKQGAAEAARFGPPGLRVTAE
jgi:hypothetical protein